MHNTLLQTSDIKVTTLTQTYVATKFYLLYELGKFFMTSYEYCCVNTLPPTRNLAWLVSATLPSKFCLSNLSMDCCES